MTCEFSTHKGEAMDNMDNMYPPDYPSAPGLTMPDLNLANPTNSVASTYSINALPDPVKPPIVWPVLNGGAEDIERMGIDGATGTLQYDLNLAGVQGVPTLLGTSMNKRLLKDYQAWPAEWAKFCTIAPIRDFKQQTRAPLPRRPTRTGVDRDGRHEIGRRAWKQQQRHQPHAWVCHADRESAADQRDTVVLGGRSA
jgi:hypothetical protein